MRQEHSPLYKLLQQLFTAFEEKDVPAVLALFADDSVLIDPHYPQTEMKGKAAIRQGLTWGVASLEQPGFAICHSWANDESGAAEVETHHILKGGTKIDFWQVFIIETCNGLITRLQSYTPYAPPSR